MIGSGFGALPVDDFAAICDTRSSPLQRVLTVREHRVDYMLDDWEAHNAKQAEAAERLNREWPGSCYGRRASTIRSRWDASTTICCASDGSVIVTVRCECGFLYEPIAPAKRCINASCSALG